MTRGTLKICTIFLVLFLAAPPAFCIACCCSAEEPAASSVEPSHGCCPKSQKKDDTLPAFAAKAACDCPDLYEPMAAVASSATADGNDGPRIQLAALIVDCVTVARPWTDARSHSPPPFPEIERRPFASLPSRAPPAVTV